MDQPLNSSHAQSSQAQSSQVRSTASLAATVYRINPSAVLYPVAENAILQLLGQQDLTVVQDASAALAFLTCFEQPSTIAAARGRFLQPNMTPAVFDHLFSAAVKLQILQADISPPGETFDARHAGTMLTTINLVAEDLTADIAVMGAAASAHVRDQTGERLDTILRRVLGDLTRVATALGRQRGAFVNAQLANIDRASKQQRLHLGAGGHNLPGWYNIDYPPAELALNLRWPLPFNSNSIELVFLSHLLEHLYKKRDAPRLLREILRVLRPGGVVRIIVPDAETYMRAYVENDEAFFAMQRQVWFTWAPRARTKLEAILGYLGAPEIPGALTQHKYGYDFATLSLMLRDAGFRTIERSSFMGSRHEALRVDDASFVAEANVDGRYASLFVEAEKPKD